MNDIVIVEDELIAAEYLKEVLLAKGFNVLGIIDGGKDAMQEIPKLQPDIVLMDIMLKDNISGSEVALHLKQHTPKIAIVFLTAYADEEMVEYALESNSYGYLMKPYNEEEIVNTLKVISERIREKSDVSQTESDILHINSELYFDLSRNRLFKNTQEVRLGNKAIRFITLLAQKPNVIISNEQIANHVWGELKSAVTLRTHIHRIRAQVQSDFIENINGVGYMIKTEDNYT